MKTLFAILLAFAATTANATIFTPTGSDQTVSVGRAFGTWTADGVTNPTGITVRIHADQGSSTPDFTWSLFDATGGDTFVPAGSQTISYLAWLAMPFEGDIYKTVTLDVGTPSYPAPQAGQQMRFYVQTTNLAANGWTIQTGTVTGGMTPSFAVTAVPEPTTLALLLPLVGFAWWRRRK